MLEQGAVPPSGCGVRLSRPSQVGWSSGEAWQLAPAETTCMGMPCAAVTVARLRPGLPRPTEGRPAFAPPHGWRPRRWADHHPG